MIVGVLIELTNKKLDRVFDYKVSDDLSQQIKLGIRVEVPFNHRVLEGFVLTIKKASDVDNLKEIIKVVDEDIVLNEELLELGKILQKKTLATLISCYQAMLPKALKAKKKAIVNKKFDVYYRLNSLVESNYNKTQQLLINEFKNQELVSKEKLQKISASSLKTLIKKNILIEINWFIDKSLKI